MEVIIHRKFEMGVRFIRKFDVEILVVRLEVAMEIGVDDELERKLILREDQFFERPFNFD